MLELIQKQLAAVGIATARIDALAIIEHVSGKNKASILSGDVELTDDQERKVMQMVERRTSREPLAYLLGSKEFYGRSFFTDKHVLIPRPESEDMIDLVLELNLPTGSEVLDIGCGSGILGITYYLEVAGRFDLTSPPARATEDNSDASRTWLWFGDIDEAALSIAKRNARSYEIRAQYCPMDVFGDWRVPAGLVLANLPYVPKGMQNELTQNNPELACEPEKAIYLPDGLAAYRALFEKVATTRSKPAIATECLSSQKNELVDIAVSRGYELHSSKGLCMLFVAR
ncbi:MAG: hypothetical protein AAF413_01845 [Patescibacteria group bacterium]